MSPSDGWREEAAGPPAVAELFTRLLESPAEERAAMLATLSERWPEQRDEVASLLAAHEAAGAFLEEPLSGGAGVLELLEPGPAEGRLVGPYRVVRELGRGGMGVVYLAERADGAFEQVVALKVVPAALASSSAVERFVRERQILARLEHPHIARLLDGGVTADGLPYFAMEPVEGAPVTEHCRDAELSVEDRLALFVDVCDAVSYAHSQLTVHRDLKPSNVLVTAGGGVKLLDFGIAKLLDDSGEAHTVTREVAATPQYAAPEQLRGEPISTATDVWALGVLLYELLTDRRPFEALGRDLESQRRMVCEADPEPPSAAARAAGAEAAAVRRLAGDLDTVVLCALRKEPERRYPSVEALAEDVRRHLEGLPVRARPATLRYRTGKFVGRHSLGVAAAVLVVASLLTGVALALWQASLARTQERLAVSAAERADAQARRAERVKDLLVAIFQPSDPTRVQGETLSARDVLDAGTERVVVDLADEPEVQAELLVVLSQIHDHVGFHDRARELAESALETHRRLHGPNDPRNGGPLVALGEALSSLSRLPEARAVFAEAVDLLERSPSAAHAQLLAQARSGLASTLQETDPQRALTLHREVHATFVELLGEGEPRTTEAQLSLAGGLEEVGDYGAAEAAYRSVLARLESSVGEKDPRVAAALSSLAGLLDRFGQLEEAGRLFERALALQREVLGPEHTQLADTLFSYGIFLLTSRRHAEALPAFDEAQAIYPRDTYSAGHCLRYGGLALMGLGRHRAAATRFAEAAEVYRRVLGDDYGDVWRAEADLGHARQKLGDLGEAERLLRRAVERIGAIYGEASDKLGRPLRLLGETLRLAGKVEEAAAMHRRASELERQVRGPEHPLVALNDLELARDLLARGTAADRAEAQGLLRRAAALLRANDPDSPDLAAIEAELARLR